MQKKAPFCVGAGVAVGTLQKDARVMNLLSHLFDILLHFNVYLGPFAESYGSWIYAILFAMIFCETGLVVTPFVPGDSLLFAVALLPQAQILPVERRHLIFG